MKKMSILLIICILILPSVQLFLAVNNQIEEISLNGNNTNGLIQYFSEINCGPLPNHDHEGSVDLTPQYQEIGIDFIRTHDFSGPTDISTIFPDFSADPTIASSYNFTSSDYYINGIIECGSEVFYRLGESASVEDSIRQPPSNFTKWAEICKHIIMHYNDGWADGYQYNITYFEVWNEPDLLGFFNGTAEQYYALYHITVETLKAYNPSLKIGGPCTSSIYNENFTTRFLSYLVEHDLPLDFYSWHMYASHPQDLYTASIKVRSFLDSYGFYDTESINTEWNINIIFPQRDKDNARNAAFTACTFTAFQDAKIDFAFRYRGTGDDNRLMRTIGFDLALFSPDGVYKTPALTYKTLHLMEKETPLRLQTPLMNASAGFTYLAGIAGDKSTMSVLLSNYEAGKKEYHITLDDVPWNADYSMIQYIIDDNNPFAIKQKIVSNASSFEFTDVIQSSTVHFFWLTNTTLIPDEGPETYPIPFLLQLRFLDIPRALLGVLLLLIFFGG